MVFHKQRVLITYCNAIYDSLCRFCIYKYVCSNLKSFKVPQIVKCLFNMKDSCSLQYLVFSYTFNTILKNPNIYLIKSIRKRCLIFYMQFKELFLFIYFLYLCLWFLPCFVQLFINWSVLKKYLIRNNLNSAKIKLRKNDFLNKLYIYIFLFLYIKFIFMRIKYRYLNKSVYIYF